MHSSHYGDHHIISPDDALPLIDAASPAELLGKVGCDAMMIAHHIGYTPGYRGICWDEYDSSVTPLVEVVSKHGCAFNETAPYPYYHTMGPRDSRNTVYEGLRRGFRFGFIGSTDHHGGYPGSYGDGKLAVWAKEKTRESIWEALTARRVYAVTGDRIGCRFSVNEGNMGEIIPTVSRLRTIQYVVRACYPIDKIIVYKNLKPLHILNGESLVSRTGRGTYKVRIETGWGYDQSTPYKWVGQVRVINGKVLDVEPCFRGASILAPKENNAVEFSDLINSLDNRILSQDHDLVSWQCFTHANSSPLQAATCSVIIEIEGSDDSVLEINVNNLKNIASLGELSVMGYTQHVKSYASQAIKVHTAMHESNYVVERQIEDQDGESSDFYHMEISQKNGSWAFVSPVYFD